MLHTNLNTNFFVNKFTAMTLDFANTAATKNLPGATADAPGVAFGGLIEQIMNISLTIGIIAVLLFLILGSIEWITAGGDKGKIEKAREKITQSIIGLIVLVSVMAIMLFVQQLLGICLIKFGGTCAQSAPPPGSCAAPSACTARGVCTNAGGTVGATCGTGLVCCTVN